MKLILVLLLTLVLTGCCQKETKTSAPKKYQLKLGLADGFIGPFLNLTKQIIEIVNQEIKIPNHEIVLAAEIYSNNLAVTNSFCNKAYRDGIQGIIGPVYSEQAVLTAMTSSSYGLPMISYNAATTVTSDRDVFPTFFKTIPTTGDQGDAFLRLLDYYEWTEVGIISSTTEYALGILSGITNAAKNFKHIHLTISFFPFIYGDVTVSLKYIQSLGIRVIIFLASPYDLIRLTVTAYELNMFGKPYVYINPRMTTTDISYEVNGISYVNETLAELYQGQLMLGTAQLDFQGKIMKKLFPTQSTVPNFFPTNCLVQAIYAYAHSFKKLITGNRTSNDITGKELTKTISTIEFEDPTVSTPTIFKFKPETGSPQIARFDVYTFMRDGSRSLNGHYVNGVLKMNENPVVWPPGFAADEIPDDTPVMKIYYFSCPLGGFYTDTRGIVRVDSPTDDDPTNLGPEIYCNSIIDCGNWNDEPYSCNQGIRVAYIVIGILAGIGLLYLFLSLVTILLFREKHLIRAAGRGFLLMSCMASIVGITSIYVTFGKVNAYKCMSFYWMLALSSALLMSSLLAKQYRVWKVFGNRTVNVVQFTELKMILFSVSGVIPDIIILLLWTIFDFPELESNSDGQVSCKSDLEILFLLLLLFTKIMVALGSLVLAFLSRKYPSAFADSKLVGIAIYNECLIGVISIPVVVSLESFFRWLLQALAILFFFLSTFGILMTPKQYMILKSNNLSSLSHHGKSKSSTSLPNTNKAPDR